ncbi:protein TonB [Sphingobium sp. OAS761]|uniref:energy transducer TonB n=1 Tax=Sphingobium sp. OAS761 TaxID=2817901 RepID=UPI00209C96C1|nr:energy transducer TonB [Sphingobium sp. OAS761]MCP1469977.1 protein TonB [Sphingobium sp. OAS761]
MSSHAIESRGAGVGYRGGRRSPVGVGATVAVHALVIGAWLLIPKEVIDTVIPDPLDTYAVPEPQAPPPEPQPPETQDTPSQAPRDSVPERPTATDPIVPSFPGDLVPGGDIKPFPPVPPPPPLPPVREPVLTEPSIDPRAMGGFQPDYPGTMIRQGTEGTVTVRVTISPEGRVTDIVKISATDESFWLATQRHALRKWRFRPATRDGVPVGSTKTLTVRFTLTDR